MSHRVLRSILPPHTAPLHRPKMAVRAPAWLVALTLLAGLFGAPPAVSAADPGLHLYTHWVDSTAFPRVDVYLSAWNDAGLPVAGLLPEQFTLQEDRGAPFHPQAVEMDGKAQLQVILVIDVSGSMAGRPLQDAQQAAARFLDRLGPADQAALIAFSGQVDPNPGVLNSSREIAFTADKVGLYDAVEKLTAEGPTELYAAVSKAAGMVAAAPEGHRAVLLLSDGRNETPDPEDPAPALALAREARAPFFVIGLGNQIDLPFLQRLAGDTGGLFRAAPGSAELADLFGDMATLLKTQYRVTYTSTLAQDGQNHSLSIGVRAADGEAQEQADFGPLPLQPATPTAVPSATPAPTAPPRPTAIVKTAETGQESGSAVRLAPTPAGSPTPPGASPLSALPGGALPWLAGGAVLLAAAAWLWLRRKPAPRPERCMKCGYEMTGRSGACPQCGETKRAPIPKGLR